MNIYDVRDEFEVLRVYKATAGHGYLSGTAVDSTPATAGTIILESSPVFLQVSSRKFYHNKLRCEARTSHFITLPTLSIPLRG